MKEKKNKKIYIQIVFVIFFLIFKFILIYSLHVLFVLKIKGIFEKIKSIFEKKNSTQKC